MNTSIKPSSAFLVIVSSLSIVVVVIIIVTLFSPFASPHNKQKVTRKRNRSGRFDVQQSCLAFEQTPKEVKEKKRTSSNLRMNINQFLRLSSSLMYLCMYINLSCESGEDKKIPNDRCMEITSLPSYPARLGAYLLISFPKAKKCSSRRGDEFARRRQS